MFTSSNFSSMYRDSIFRFHSELVDLLVDNCNPRIDPWNSSWIREDTRTDFAILHNLSKSKIRLGSVFEAPVDDLDNNKFSWKDKKVYLRITLLLFSCNNMFNLQKCVFNNNLNV